MADKASGGLVHAAFHRMGKPRRVFVAGESRSVRQAKGIHDPVNPNISPENKAFQRALSAADQLFGDAIAAVDA
jgi:hypothetical protein